MRSRRVVAVAAALMAVLVLSGCFSRVAIIHTPAGYLYGADGVAEPVCADPIDPSEGELVGPHFGLRVTCAAFGPSIALMSDADMSPIYPDRVPPAATTGHEFVVVQFGDDTGIRPYHPVPDPETLVIYILIGDERVAVAESPVPGYVLVAVGPIGQPAFLVVEDDGREQRFNLRDRVRESEIPGFYDATEGFESTSGYDVRIEGENSAWTGWAEGNGDINVIRTVWDSERGYAADGRAYVTVRLTWYKHEKDGKIAWDMVIEDSLKLLGPSDEKYDIVEVDDTPDGKLVHYDVHFDVPDDVTQFTVSFTPKGRLWIVDDGSTLKVTKKPKKTEHTVDFGR